MSQTPTKSDPDLPPGTPRWVKVLGLIALVLLLLFVIVMLIGGEHGPSRHRQPSSSGENYPVSMVALDHS